MIKPPPIPQVIPPPVPALKSMAAELAAWWLERPTDDTITKALAVKIVGLCQQYQAYRDKSK